LCCIILFIKLHRILTKRTLKFPGNSQEIPRKFPGPDFKNPRKFPGNSQDLILKTPGIREGLYGDRILGGKRYYPCRKFL
jgi:hypothetical protein